MHLPLLCCEGQSSAAFGVSYVYEEREEANGAVHVVNYDLTTVLVFHLLSTEGGKDGRWLYFTYGVLTLYRLYPLSFIFLISAD